MTLTSANFVCVFLFICLWSFLDFFFLFHFPFLKLLISFLRIFDPFFNIFPINLKTKNSAAPPLKFLSPLKQEKKTPGYPFISTPKKTEKKT